ncbi:Hsp20/alpha crystallin family protein [Candidatus Jidaibacter acanthamoebae]|nr:Hsp20/alpha crystallin family protein [Candidatus Jidaibacter acanthamoeba]
MAKSLIPWDWLKDNGKRNQVSIRREDPSFSKLYSDMERMMNDMFNDYLPTFPRERGKGADIDFLTPKINISETENEYKISAEIPGVEEKDIDLSINKGMLLIKAEKKEEKEEKEEKDEQYHRYERYYGTFQRTISLPEDIDENSIKAKFKGGVLNITIKKNKEAQPATKKIEVKGE